jgi:RNA polymerase sigma-70 factor (ECF subfamily)
MGHDRAQINEWMNRAAIGDTDAFGKLASAVQDDLFRLALACGLGWTDAREVTQEVLLRAYRGRKNWQKNRDVMPWIYGIAVNVTREMRRKIRRRPITGFDLEAAATDRSPDGTSANLDLSLLVDSLERLPPRQREAVACRFLRGLSIADTAAAMECAEGTVKATVFAALANLRRMMKAGQ